MKRILSILLLFSLFSLNSCETTNDIVDDIWDYSQQHPQGFTVTIPDIMDIQKGIAVAYLDTQNSFGYQSLRFVVTHALSHNLIVGGWLNEEDGLYYFDSIKVFNDNEMDEAIEFALQNQQTAIYDITNGVTIYVADYLTSSDGSIQYDRHISQFETQTLLFY